MKPRGLGALILVIVLVASGITIMRGLQSFRGAGNPYGDPIWIAVDGKEHEAAASAAADYWSSGAETTRWRPHFAFTDDREAADIIVTFSDERTIPCGIVIGHVEAQGCGGIIQGKGFARIATAGLDDQQIRKVTTHEVGHAIGLAHTLDKASVMYETVDGLPLWAQLINWPFGNLK